MPFQVTGTDFAVTIYYRTKLKKEWKVYILIFFCSVGRAVHLELIPNTRRQLSTIHSDNTKSFQAAAKWLKQIITSEQLHEHLKENMNWIFILPKAPWWGWHFERLIGVTKQALYRSLRWSELEVLLDVETNINNRPLTYIEENIKNPILTPNSTIPGRDTKILDGNMIEDKDFGWRKRQKYVKRCKDAA